MFFRNIFYVAICVAACSAVFTSSAFAQNGPPAIHKKNTEAFQALLELEVEVDHFETRLEDVLAELRKVTGLMFLIDESAADNSVDAETLFTIKFSETRLSTVLRSMLAEFSCTWTILDGVVIITSEDAALDISNMSLMTFDCNELVKKIEPLVITVRDKGKRGFGGSSSGGVFSLPTTKPQEESKGDDKAQTTPEAGKKETDKDSDKAKAAESNQPTSPAVWQETVSGRQQLIKTIQEMVDPDSWVRSGGNGRITALNNIIIVHQTQQNLIAIADLLDELNSVEVGDP